MQSSRSKEGPMEWEREKLNSGKNIFSPANDDIQQNRDGQGASEPLSPPPPPPPTPTTAYQQQQSRSALPNAQFSFSTTPYPLPHTPTPSFGANKSTTPFLFSAPNTDSTIRTDRRSTVPDRASSRFSAYSFHGSPQPASDNAYRRVKRRREAVGTGTLGYWRAGDGGSRKRRVWRSGSEDEDMDGLTDESEDENMAKGRDGGRGAQPRSIGKFDEPSPFYEPSTYSTSVHKDIPYIVSGYLQMLFNMILISMFLYVVTQFIKTVQHDVDSKVEEYSLEILSEIAACGKSYIENRCDPDTRVPGMERACRNWENCMNRDPTVVGRAKVSAETFAEIINSFVEPISYKAMGFLLTFAFGSLIASNFAFSHFRSSRETRQQLAPSHIGVYSAYGNPNMAINNGHINPMWTPVGPNRYLS